MDDRVERGEGGVIAHDLPAQRGAVQAAAGCEHVGAEAPRDRGQDGGAGRLRVAGEAVRVDHRRAPFFEELDHGRLAGSDVARESDVKHRTAVSGVGCLVSEDRAPDTRHLTPDTYSSAV